ncbi:SAM-dependent methyltransferase [Alkalibacillus flavidus]|uniref:SAM-dependent methyltransferase n=1 Tax=Alkalibacillus flavidus TaxID=546021 RepID=A0ABV2KSB9_9BACI
MAYVYDELMNDVPYENWELFTRQTIDKYFTTSPERILDVGCGTGELTLKLAGLSQEIVGLDQSQDMIDVAQQKSFELQKECHWIQGDARQFQLNQTFDMVVSYLDVMNYMVEPNDLFQTFQTIYQHLNAGGLFVFDSHSIHYIELLIESEMFADIRDNVSYVWLTEPGEHRGEINHDLTFFVQEEDGRYTRFDESHRQRVFTIDDMREWLHQAGFKLLSVVGDWGQTEDLDEADRLFYICQK